MKPQVKIVCIGLLIPIIISSACKRPNDQEIGLPQSRLAMSATISFLGSDKHYIKYDTEGKIIQRSITSYSSDGDSNKADFLFTYTKDAFSFETYENGTNKGIVSEQLNADGFIDQLIHSADTLDITYANGLMIEALVQYTSGDELIKLVYDGDDVVKQQVFEDGLSSGEFQYEFYKDIKDPMRISTLLDEEDAPNALRFFNPVFGRPNQHLLKSFKLVEGEEIHVSFTFFYEFDAFNNPAKILVDNGINKRLIATIAYTY